MTAAYFSATNFRRTLRVRVISASSASRSLVSSRKRRILVVSGSVWFAFAISSRISSRVSAFCDTSMREHFGRDPEALEWAERLPVQDYEELIGGRPGAGS